MKKNLLLLVAIIFIQYSSKAQSSCDGRYQNATFSYTIDTGVVYGSNVNAEGITQTLAMDIYLPNPDTLSERPVIVFAHGGYFVDIFGNRHDSDVIYLCEYYAARGYVCVSYDYRTFDLGELTLPLSQTALLTAYMGSQDARAVNRFLRKDAATTNAYKIDPTQIFAGGVSAGAFNALNVGYLLNDAEVEAIGIDTTVYGGIEGTTGSLGYRSNAKVVVNLCGALAQVSYIQNGDIPVCSMHGDSDKTVPFDYGFVSLMGINIIPVYGSEAIDSACKAVGVESDFHDWIGAPHVPFAGGIGEAINYVYMDSVTDFVTPFLFNHLTCNGFTGIKPVIAEGNSINVYPVPSASEVTVAWNNDLHKSFNAEVVDYSGKVVKSYNALWGNTFLIDRGNLAKGIYFLKMQSGNDFRYGKIIFN